MHRLIFILFPLLISQLTVGQASYHLSDFQIKQDALIKGTHSHTKGLDIQFRFSPYQLDNTTHEFTIKIEAKEQLIAQQSKTFTYQYTDSIAYLVDSLGIDSLPNLDTIVHLYIPYREIAVEEGDYTTNITITTKGKTLPVYSRPFLLHQVKIYDLFLALKTATIVPDSNANPLGLGYHAPDPKWLVKLGDNQTLHGLVNRNKFKTKPKSFSTTMTNYDSLIVCVHNADPTAANDMGCFLVEHGAQNFNKKYQQLTIGHRIKEATFEVKKIERKPISSHFLVTEQVEHKGIQGIKLAFNYSLPLQYKRRNIGIKITDEKQASFANIMPLTQHRKQEDNRIIGAYSYFIPYYNLQHSKQIKLLLTGNDKIIQHHKSKELTIVKTVDSASLQQTAGYIHNGLSGILYQLEVKFDQLPKEGQLKIAFPSLSKKTIAQLSYWTSTAPNKIYAGSHQKIPLVYQQTIFVFLPYFVAPQHIQLTPYLLFEGIDIPAIQLIAFKSQAYACPSSLNDIQIHATSHEEHLQAGLSGQLFRFSMIVPDYYHSKGFFDLQILANGTTLNQGFFINNDANQPTQFPIHNQKKIEVFIPYRFMQKDAHYEVILQAKSNNFALSESRKEQFNNTLSPVQTIGFYLQHLVTKDWDQIVYKVGLRNDKNPNSTYEHLGYTIIIHDTISNHYKPDFPVALDFEAALKDEIIIWIKEKDQSDDQALRFKTSIAMLLEEKNTLSLQHTPSLKKALFKAIPRAN
ncbi:hypothetical protein [Aureispira anguillae]|uniref:Uncharacterized protein n=1 Tax=Aureispira anguillae TaxID=2864201 RepID=A0A915YFJ7_9BACT|nr:hypothetical protein [Aureispira anguillae]BDS12076.1 hypothetical protein AsAng_0027910 [Aureispira anguillae]